MRTSFLSFLVLLMIIGGIGSIQAQELKPGFIRIHYQQSGKNVENLALWLWDDFSSPSNGWPQGATSFTGRDKFGVYADVEPLENARKISFLFLDKTTGTKFAGNKECIMKKNQTQFWTRENDDNVYTSPDFKPSCEIISASIIDKEKVKLNFEPTSCLKIDNLKENICLKDALGNKPEIAAVEATGSNSFILTVKLDLEKTPITVKYGEKTIVGTLCWQLVDSLYAYSGDDLGCKMNRGNATLKIWAPLASKVDVLIFDRTDQTKQVGSKALSRREKGVWTCEIVPGELKNISDLRGYYYQYEILNPGELPKKVLDPYAKSMAPVTIDPSGSSAGSSNDFVGKAAFVIPEEVGKTPAPVNIKGFEKREDAIIYEIHVRDFTSDPSIAGDLKARWGSFHAFTEKLSYIKSLGVTHVQLLPVMAWYFGDETAMKTPELKYSARNNQYNWGYDPQNYFSLDGAYSEKPEDAERRIAEFKELVDAVHSAGMGVILDVVYTHMSKAGFLNDIVPDYYFFKDAEGKFVGDFGNNLATTRKMAEKLMVDSVKYWFDQYKIDGMRWDMMGDATSDSVQRAFDAAVAINPHAIFIGEGWRTFKGHLEDPALKGKGADQDWMAKTDSVGVFSDEFRNELKSGFGCEGEPMFLTGGARNIENLFRNIKAQPTNTPANAPGDMVQYIEAHDNLPLFDVIAQSIKKDPEITENDIEIHRRIRLGNTILLTSQGTAFLNAGQEFGRTKQWKAPGKPEHKFHEFADASGKPFIHPYFIHDSYDSSDAVNMFDWGKALDEKRFPVNALTGKYTRGLIALRRSTDAFRLGAQTLVNKNVTLLKSPEIREKDLVIVYTCRSTDNISYVVCINADTKTRELSLKTDLTQGDIVVDAQTAGTIPISNPKGVVLTSDRMVIEPLTAVIIRVKERGKR
ncbi:MAG: pullulanase [Candidatus Ozemobacteraceae bacterium]